MDTYVVMMMNTDTHVVGELKVEDNVHWICRPRMLVMVQKQNQLMARMIKLLGDPSKVRIPKGVIWYEIVEAELVNLYIKETTGLVLPR